MDIFRWIMGVLGGLLFAGWIVFFFIGLVRADDEQMAAAKRLRQWAVLAGLTWFNVEIWGRVVWTIVTWP